MHIAHWHMHIAHWHMHIAHWHMHIAHWHMHIPIVILTQITPHSREATIESGFYKCGKQIRYSVFINLYLEQMKINYCMLLIIWTRKLL